MTQLQIAILATLAEGDTHAYKVFQRIQTDAISDTLATDRQIYRELPRLIKEGSVSKVEATPVKYHLTSTGRQHLKTERARALQLIRVLNERI